MRAASRRPADPALRAVTATGLITMGIIHAVEIQGELGGAVAGVWLLVHPTVPAWAFAGLVGLLAALGYMATRSFGVPGDHDDVGNWLEPLGLVALITEWLVVILVGLALGSQRGAASQASMTTEPAVRELAHGQGTNP
jgi:hypothetical protein